MNNLTRANSIRISNFKSFSNRLFRYTRNYSTECEAKVVISENGKAIHLSSGRYARFANASAVCQMGETAVLVTAVSSNKPTSFNFMPLTVDYRLKYAAAGRIPTNFFRKELAPTEKEILSGRLVDRSIRPLFPSSFRCDTQVVCNMLAMDSVYMPDVLSINAASLALSLSDIPWNGPVAAVRMGLIDNELVVNPSRIELQSSDLDLVVTATKHNFMVMLEGKANAIPYQTVLKAIKSGMKTCKTIIATIENLAQQHGKVKRTVEEPTRIDEEVVGALRSMCEMRLYETFRNTKHDKTSRDESVSKIREDTIDRVWSSYPQIDRSILLDEFNGICKYIFRDLIFQGERCDGRGFNDLRPISCEVDLYEPLHGSALFQRGQTQVLEKVALDSIDSAMKLDSLASLDTGVKSKNFFLHYEFPPYATGEIGKVGGIGRREVGHGALAEKALMPVIPSNYPFTIRLTSEVLESNGSSSMATVCGGSLALMDAGVPIKEAVAGVAIGLVTKYDSGNPNELEDYRLLTDILGIEDYLGDMDMKIAGTKVGITAFQADIKTHGIPMKVVTESFERAITAKAKILSIMNECLAQPRSVEKSCWPVTSELTIQPNQRSQLLGPGGINLKKIFVETGAHLTQIDESKYNIFAPSKSALDETMCLIKDILKPVKAPELEFGGIYTATIVEVRDVGILVKLYDSMQPTLIHISQLDNRKVAHASALGFKEGDQLQVKYFGTDPVSGYMRLSKKKTTALENEVVINLNK